MADHCPHRLFPALVSSLAAFAFPTQCCVSGSPATNLLYGRVRKLGLMFTFPSFQIVRYASVNYLVAVFKLVLKGSFGACHYSSFYVELYLNYTVYRGFLQKVTVRTTNIRWCKFDRLVASGIRWLVTKWLAGPLGGGWCNLIRLAASTCGRRDPGGIDVFGRFHLLDRRCRRDRIRQADSGADRSPDSVGLVWLTADTDSPWT